MAKKKATYKGTGNGTYKVTDRKNPRYGKSFRKDAAGNHVYKSGKVVGKRTVPFDASAPIKTQAEFDTRTNAATQLRYGDQQTDLEGQKRASAQQSANVGNWFEGYKQDVAAANARQAQNLAATQQQIYSQANTSRAQDTAQGQQLDQAGQAAASLRGGQMAPSVAPQAAAGRQALNNSFGGMVGAQGVAQGAYGAQQQASAGGMRAQALSNELGNRRKLDVSQQKLEADKGAYRVEYGDKLRGAEHTRRLEISQLGTARQKAELDALDDAADNARQDRVVDGSEAKRKADKRKDNYQRKNKVGPYAPPAGTKLTAYQKSQIDKDKYLRDNKLGPYKPAKGGGGGGSKKGGSDAITPSSRRSAQTDLRNIYRTAGQYKSKSWAWHYKNARSANKGVDDDIIRAGIQRGKYGAVEPGLARALKRRYGIGMKVKRPSTNLTGGGR